MGSKVRWQEEQEIFGGAKKVLFDAGHRRGEVSQALDIYEAWFSGIDGVSGYESAEARM